MNKKDELLNKIRSLAHSIKESLSNPFFSEKELGDDIQQLQEFFILYKHTEDSKPEAAPVVSLNENTKSNSVKTDLFSSIPDILPNQKVKKEEPVPHAYEVENTGPKTFMDVKDAIGLNDKFRFTNELFEGSAQEYTAAIEQLNAMSSADEAEVFLNSIRDIYEWKDDNATAEEFITLVQKRYA